jgi:RNA-directed DNA polymerase
MAGLSLKQSILRLTKPTEQLVQEFHAIEDFDGIADLLELTPPQLYHFTHSGQKYHQFTIPKKHGGQRTIAAPGASLKFAQKKLNQVLQALYQPGSVVHGFVCRRGVVSNAAAHSKRRYILNIDLQNFFETISFPRVRGMFMAKPYSRNGAVATTLARLCCYNGVLAQGAPTSPVISNMLLGRLDSHLKSLARTHKCTYTRYADDITFSTFVARFPRALAHFADEESGGGSNHWRGTRRCYCTKRIYDKSREKPATALFKSANRDRTHRKSLSKCPAGVCASG